MCKQTKSALRTVKNVPTEDVHTVKEKVESLDLYRGTSNVTSVPTVTAFHQDVPVHMETVSLIGEDLYLRHSSGLPFSPTISLQSCSGHTLDLLREMDITVEFNKQTAILNLTVEFNKRTATLNLTV
jgi:hypothetical protein